MEKAQKSPVITFGHLHMETEKFQPEKNLGFENFESPKPDRAWFFSVRSNANFTQVAENMSQVENFFLKKWCLEL